MSSEERLILKGHLSNLKMEKMELETRIGANIKAAKTLLAAASIKPIADIDLHGALCNLQEAVEQKNRLAYIVSKIRQIRQELD